MTTPSQLDDSQHRSHILLNLHELYKSKEYCDVTLCVTDPQSPDQVYSIECHKVMLIAASPYFKDVLDIGDVASNVNMVDLGTGNLDTLKEALSFIYSGKCAVSSGNVMELLKLSLTWKLQTLEKRVSEVFAKYLSVENFIAAYELVQEHKRVDLQEHISYFVRKIFHDVVDADCFKDMPLSLLIDVLKEDELNVESENVLVKAVLYWMEHNSSTYTGMNDLWSLVRFQHLTPDYLIEEVLHHPLMQEEPQKGLVKGTLLNLCKDDTVARGAICRYWGEKPVYDKLGKITTDHKIYVYDDEKKKWKLGGDAPDWVDTSTHCCVDGDKVILLGSFLQNGKCAFIDVEKFVNTLFTHSSGKDKDLCGVAAVDSYIYSLGGGIDKDNEYVSNEVNRLNARQTTNTWELIESLPIAVGCPLVFTYRHMIFVIGGCNNEYRYTFANQMYDTSVSKWHLLSPAPQACKSCYSFQHGGFVQNGKIHISTCEHYMTYTIDTDSWTCVKYEDIGYHIQPVLRGDQILACVRHTNIEEDEPSDFMCKRYDEESNRWEPIDIDVKDCMAHRFLFAFKSHYK